ncbi:MAG TPA: biotin--[acetyl-CoA-carboxylase] ligase [Methanocorpusculum sp.]|nr:biotin--[acetyl-CoA-carboxylase] ligase [Methanocorpusculum sp.]
MQQILQNISAEKILTFLPDDFAGEIIIKDTTASTNADAKEYALCGARVGTAVIAETQTAGRGRLGRVFYSPEQSGIYLTILLPAEHDTLLKITPFAGVAVCKTIESFSDEHPQIKWVNDVYLRGKKVCGILSENIPQKSLAAVGMGINLYPAEFPEELREIAGSVFTDTSADKNAFIGTLIRNLTDRSLFERTIHEYRRRSYVVGKHIRYIENGVQHEADAVGIDDCGGLIIRENGSEKTLFSGEITLRLAE